MDKTQVEKATRALLAFVQKKDREASTKGSKKPTNDLIAEADGKPEALWAIIATKKLPMKLHIKPISIPLPHAILPANAEVCLITKDPQREFKDLVASAGITRVSRVIGVSKLRSKFKPYEAKRKLCASYDVFIADERVLPLLPPLLGKTFFEKKKHPSPVNLTKKDVKAEIERVLNSTQLHLNKGACNALRVGLTTLTLSQNVDNIMEAVKAAVEKLPGKWKNVQSINIKTSASIALPVYNSRPDEPASDDDDDEEEAGADDADSDADE
ncbi:ribosomal protein L1p/L10e family-domain-containing protein [Entophlyctis helioformis]|nr:ribosomal protein L1p/L10e family-domain-containing protein [Entophlyctis helioformis]